jgi:hypothetical protein
MDAPNAWIESRKSPMCDVPPLIFGSMPNDGGFLSDWDDEQKESVISKYPLAEKFFRRLLGSQEFINNKPRWCLWLKGVSPSEIRNVPPVMEAIAKVREMRQSSKRDGTRKLADVPMLFGEIRQPESGNYLLVPSVSSERREYVPMGFMDSNTIASNLVLIVPSATLYHFGILTSSIHMAWMRTVCGRLETRYRYSANIVYNNFPWPDVGFNTETQRLKGTEETSLSLSLRASVLRQDSEKSPNLQNSQSPSSESNNSATLPLCVKNAPTGLCDSLCSLRQKIESTAQAILDARAKYPDATLAQMYGDKMYLFPELVAAHAANDAAVMKAYGYAPTMTEPEIVADLMRRYQELAISR